MNNKPAPDTAILTTLGDRIARHRLNRNLTQDALAAESGISKPTLQRLEAGQSTQTSSLIRVLRALGLLENLNALVPAPPVSPLQQVHLEGKRRKRASSSRTETTGETPWTWGDEDA